MIDDDVVKKKILEYIDDPSNLDDIKMYISGYVYNFPRKVFRTEHNRAVDFYIYYMDRFAKILSSYKITDVKFKTWLTCTLRTSYLNYINKINKSKNLEVTEISLDSILFTRDGAQYSWYDRIAGLDYTKKSNDSRRIEKINNYIETQYTDLESIVFRMHYLEVFHFFLPTSIMRYFDFTQKEVLDFLHDAKLTYIDKYDNFIKLQDRCTVILLKIMTLDQNELNHEKIKTLQEKKERYLARLKQFRVVVPYSYLSSKFDIKTNKISKIVLKIKQDIKSHF